MLEFFQKLWDTVLGIFKLIGLIFGMLIDLLTVAMNYIKALLSFFPSWMLVIGVILIAVCVLYKIFGREASS